MVSSVPIRSCIGCGRTVDKRELLRLLVDGAVVVADLEGSLPGRSTYICRSAQCAEAALKKKGLFARALKKAVEAPSREDLIGWVNASLKEG